MNDRPNAQHIGVSIVSEQNEVIESTDINFVMVAFRGLQKHDEFPWLSTIDEFGATWINEHQSKHLIAELEHINLNDEERATANQAIEILKKATTSHCFVRFDGD